LSGKEILDVGCAGGRETAYLASKGLQATGCDLSPSFIRLASKAYPQCSFFVADMRNIETARKYDGIWCNAAFLHVPKSDAPATLKGFCRLLKPEGVLYLSVMRGDFEGLRENKQMGWPERHFSEYSQKELDQMTTKAGFQKIADTSNDTDWGTVFLHGCYRKA
jgi:2-polyprenyl-3-methyl-5-hydroxy-6-metoxy-1,4-benzoquinol methylase